jgi:hypothetical protein
MGCYFIYSHMPLNPIHVGWGGYVMDIGTSIYSCVYLSSWPTIFISSLHVFISALSKSFRAAI